MIPSILREGAVTLRPGHPFGARLERVAGTDLLLEATSEPVAGVTRVCVTDAPQGEVVRTGKLRGWPDLRRDEALRRLPQVGRLGWRCVIGIPFLAGGEHYVLSFVSERPLLGGFSARECEHVERVAAALAVACAPVTAI